MNVIYGIQRRLLRSIRNNIDLLVLWLLFIAIQPQISEVHILAREDLLPWLMFCLCGTIMLRGKRYGEGPHISLTQKKSTFGWLLRKVVVVFLPILLLFWYDMGLKWILIQDGKEIGAVILPVLLTILSGMFLRLSSEHERTAWDPPGIPGWFLWGFFGLCIIGASFFLGFAKHKGWIQNGAPPLLGIGFFCAGSVMGRVKNLRQRLAAGNKDGGRYRPAFFNFFFASVGAGFGLWALFLINQLLGLGDTFGFELAFVPAAPPVAPG